MYFFLNLEKNWKIPRMESKIKSFLIEKNKINKNKELLETKWTSKCKKKKNTTFLSKIVTSEAFQRVTDETLQQSHLKFGTTGEAQNFRIKKKMKNAELWKTTE